MCTIERESERRKGERERGEKERKRKTISVRQWSGVERRGSDEYSRDRGINNISQGKMSVVNGEKSCTAITRSKDSHTYIVHESFESASFKVYFEIDS